MKSGNALLLAALIACACHNTAHAQWTECNGPYGGSVYALVEMNSTIFAGTANGVHRSTDSGHSWKRISNGLPQGASVRSIFLTTKGIFIGTWNGIYFSSDSGNHWGRTSGNFSDSILSLMWVDDSGTTLFAEFPYSNFIRSTDSGVHWNADTTGLSGSTVNCVYSKNHLVVCGTFGGAGAYRSTNNGDKWVSDTDQIGATSFYQFSVLGGVLIVQGSNSLLQTTDVGATWIVHRSTGGIGDVAGFVEIGDTLFTGSTGKFGGPMFRSLDSGQSWQAINNGRTTSAGVNAIVSIADTILVGTEDGLYRSTDRGDSWSESNEGLDALIITALCTSGDTIYAGTTGSSFAASGLYKSTNRGAHWERSSTGMYYGNPSGDPIYPAINSIAALGNVMCGSNEGVYLTTDGCEHWFTPEQVRNIGGQVAVERNAAFFSGQSIFRSRDSGITWESILAQAASDFSAHDGKVVVKAYSDTVYSSTDDGDTWVTNKFPSSIFAASSDTIFAAANGVQRSTNNGSSWDTLPNELIHSNVTELISCNHQLFAVTSSAIFRSIDGAESWNNFMDGFVDTSITALASMNNSLFAAPAIGAVWNINLNPEKISYEPRTGAIVSLAQNIPNPFTGATTISFTIGTAGAIHISVTDVLGRVCAELCNEFLPAGNYTRIFWADKLQSGLYVCSLQSAAGSDNKKMLVIK